MKTLTNYIKSGVLFTVILLTVSCEQERIPTKLMVDTVVVIDSGLLGGYHWKVFQDTETNSRILYFKNAMVVLPEKDIEAYKEHLNVPN